MNQLVLVSIGLLVNASNFTKALAPTMEENKATIHGSSIIKVGETLKEFAYANAIKAAKPTKPHLFAKVGNVVPIFVDVQNDFCGHLNNAQERYTPSLAIPGAKAAIVVMNAIRMAGKFADSGENKATNKFAAIYRTEDYHPADHFSFATSSCWEDKTPKMFKGFGPTEKVKSFTRYKFELSVPSSYAEPKQVKTLDRDISLWPSHCIAGTKGQRVNDDLDQDDTDYVVLKGMYKFRESLTAVVQYDVGESIPKNFDPSGKPISLINLKTHLGENPGAKILLVMGFEFMNSVKATAVDLAKIEDTRGYKKYDVYILVDAVGYFAPPEARIDCLKELSAAGVELIESKDILFLYKGMVNTP